MEMVEVTFKAAWAIKEAAGYRYGSDALENVRLGWEMATAALADENAALRDLIGDAYYVLTYVQELYGDVETQAACQDVRDKIDARQALGPTNG